MSNADNNLAQRGIAYIRKELAAEYPYISSAIYALKLIEDEKEPTLSTDGRHLFYNPEYILKCYEGTKMYKELKYRYLHILLHCLLGHVYKKNEDNQSLYDMCADFMVNMALERLTGRGRKLPSSVKYSEKFLNLREHAVKYSLDGFRKYCREKEEQGSYLQRIGEKFYSDQHRYWTQNHPKVPGSDKGVNKEIQDIEDMWKKLLVHVTKMGVLFGKNVEKRKNDPLGFLEQEIRASEDNASSYKRLLQRMCSLRENIQTDDTVFDYIWYEIGMENYGNIPLIEPAECVEEPTVDNIIIAIDTSGSCAGETASRFLRETCNLLRDMNIRGDNYQVRVLQCDAKIQKEIIIHSEEDIPDFEEQILHGYGGTDFRPVFEHIEKLRKQGEIQKVTGLIYFTDAEGDFPEESPDYETIFVVQNLYGDMGIEPDIPEWITTIMLTEDDIEELSE